MANQVDYEKYVAMCVVKKFAPLPAHEVVYFNASPNGGFLIERGGDVMLYNSASFRKVCSGQPPTQTFVALCDMAWETCGLKQSTYDHEIAGEDVGVFCTKRFAPPSLAASMHYDVKAVEVFDRHIAPLIRVCAMAKPQYDERLLAHQAIIGEQANQIAALKQQLA
jgi:hypothetical protein